MENIHALCFMLKREIETMKILLAYRKTEGKNDSTQIAHLVFSDTQANCEKPKELFFCQFAPKEYIFVFSILKE